MARSVHLSPRHSGSVNVNASACCPYIRCSSSLRAGGVLVDLRAAPAQIVGVAAGHGHEPCESHLAVPGGKLGLAPQRRLLGLSLAGGLRLAESEPQIVVGPVPCDGGLDLAGRALGRDRLKRHRNRAHGARVGEQRVHEHRRDVDAWPGADPVRGVNRSVAAVVVPGLASSERPRIGLFEAARARDRLPRARRAPCGSTGQTRCAGCARSGPR